MLEDQAQGRRAQSSPPRARRESCRRRRPRPRRRRMPYSRRNAALGGASGAMPGWKRSTFAPQFTSSMRLRGTRRHRSRQRRDDAAAPHALAHRPAPQAARPSSRSSRDLREPGGSTIGALTSSTAGRRRRFATASRPGEVVVALHDHVGPEAGPRGPPPGRSAGRACPGRAAASHRRPRRSHPPPAPRGARSRSRWPRRARPSATSSTWVAPPDVPGRAIAPAT